MGIYYIKTYNEIDRKGISYVELKHSSVQYCILHR